MRKLYTTIGAISAFILLISPLSAAAQEPGVSGQTPGLFAGLVIAEVQPGSETSASEEFIELYNYSDQTITFSPNWHVDITSSTSTRWINSYRVVTLTGSIAPGESYVIASEYKDDGNTIRYLPTVAKAWYSAGIAATAGHIRIAYGQETDPACDMLLHVVDEVEWTTTTGGQPVAHSLDSRTIYTEASKTIDNHTSLQRKVLNTGDAYDDTDNDMLDFSAQAPTPGTAAVARNTPEHPTAWANPTCVQPALPTESSSEPSDPPETTTPPTAEGSDGQDTQDSSSEVPVDATPVEGVPASNDTIQSPQITELLPNPASPQTDAHDEYIELFNPNDTAFNLGGYTLETGLTTKHRYTFPQDTMLPANAYVAFYVTQTDTSLSNDSGRAQLYDVANEVVSRSDSYASAPEGKVWALVNGSWQWFDSPTPNTPNVLVTPVSTVKKAATAAAKKKTTAVKAASTKTAKTAATAKARATAKTKQPKQPKTKTASLTTVANETRRPVHGGILAAVGVFAVLYGAYEYRHDVANKFQQFRKYRATRRKNRASATGR
jgi:hypothetical protein